MLRRKIHGIRVAMRAVLFLWREETSFRIQVSISAALLLLSWALAISRSDLLLVALLIGMVLAIEAINTAIEELCDMHTREHDPRIARIKDLGAAASLLVGAATVIVTGTIFIPPLLSYL